MTRRLLENTVVKLAASGEEGPALGTIVIGTTANSTVVVCLDPRFYKADGNDDGWREVPVEKVTPVEL